ncbi:fimbria/pilus outer membrane usher protein [Pseudomonas sp. QL9]|uniref:fimbria/pilus outer membrane usher protein n=1 Tax=Pseudomonas sp. QL9 TaxID=3242725 RepID=UPI00352A6FCA
MAAFVSFCRWSATNGRIHIRDFKGDSIQPGSIGTNAVDLVDGDLQRINRPGESRVLVNTNGVSGAPVKCNGALTHTNLQGRAVVADASDHYRNKISIDLDAPPKKAEAIRSIQQATLTEDMIGYRKLEVVAGEKVMALIILESGGKPPSAPWC